MSSDALVCSSASADIYDTDLQTVIQPNGWLTDSVLTFYFDKLQNALPKHALKAIKFVPCTTTYLLQYENG